MNAVQTLAAPINSSWHFQGASNLPSVAKTVSAWKIEKLGDGKDLLIKLELNGTEQITLQMPATSLTQVLQWLSVYEVDAFNCWEAVCSRI